MYIYFEHSLIVILIFLRIHSLQHAASQSLAGEQSSKLLLQAVLSETTLARYSTLQVKTSVLTNSSSSVMNRETKHKNCHHPEFFLTFGEEFTSWVIKYIIKNIWSLIEGDRFFCSK